MAKNQIKKILVGLDGSKNSIRALTKAIMLAKQTNASITGIFVIHVVRTEMGLVQTTTGNEISKKYKKFVDIVKSKCKKYNVKFFDVIKHGEEGKTVVSFAKKEQLRHNHHRFKRDGNNQRNISWKHIKLRHTQIKNSCFDCKMS